MNSFVLTEDLPPIRLEWMESHCADQSTQTDTDANQQSDSRWMWVQTFLHSKSFARNTQRTYERELKRFLHWTELDWLDITSEHVGLYKKYLTSACLAEPSSQPATERACQLSPSSVNAALVALKSFYAWFCLVNSKLMPSEPTRGLRLEKLPTPSAQNLTAEQMDKIWQAVSELGVTQFRDRALVYLLVHGLRAEEATNLNIGSYDGRLMFISKSKNREPRIVPLSQTARDAISAYIETLENQKSDAPLLVSYHPSYWGRRLSYAGLHEAINRLRLISGIEDLHPHRFRHTFATDILLQGLDYPHAMKLTGHRSAKVFQRYTLSVAQQAAVNAFFRAIGESDLAN